MTLQEWANENVPKEEMFWKDAFWEQIVFVRDQVAGLMSRTYEEYRGLVTVVGTHTSKSILCPVYHINLPHDSVKIWMRYNYYDWNISVDSKRPIVVDFLDCFSTHSEMFYGMEGMSKHKFKSYAEDQSRFTVCTFNHYDCHTFFRGLKKALNIKYKEK